MEGNPLCYEEKILERKEYWRVKRLNESVHMLVYNTFLSKPRIALNII